MHKRMTITLDEDVYEGLNRMVGKRRMSQFISDVLRPHVSEQSLEAGYRAMADDLEREQDAREWIEALSGDGLDAAR
jgi:predicted CopG family antitoxin